MGHAQGHPLSYLVDQRKGLPRQPHGRMRRAALGRSRLPGALLLQAPQVAAGQRRKVNGPHRVVLHPRSAKALSYTACSALCKRI